MHDSNTSRVCCLWLHATLQQTLGFLSTVCVRMRHKERALPAPTPNMLCASRCGRPTNTSPTPVSAFPSQSLSWSVHHQVIYHSGEGNTFSEILQKFNQLHFKRKKGRNQCSGSSWEPNNFPPFHYWTSCLKASIKNHYKTIIFVRCQKFFSGPPPSEWQDLCEGSGQRYSRSKDRAALVIIFGYFLFFLKRFK